jgi:hypothetical protein
MCKHRTEKIKITQRDIKKCEEFAHAQLETSKEQYARRNQRNLDKIVKDITTGKLGEIGAYRLLSSNGFNVSKPDFEIYAGRRKSFDADLCATEFHGHCKSQNIDSADKYGISWILQYGGRGYGHTDKLFKQRSKEDYLIPSLVHEKEVEIFGIIPVDLLFERDLVKEPRVAWLADTKRAIYYEDLKELSWKERWGILS